MFTKHFLFILTILVPSFVFANVNVEATIDRANNVVGVGEEFTYTISVTSSEPQTLGSPRLPGLEEFQILGQNDQVQTQSFMSGGVFQIKQTYLFNFRLAASKKGKITIGEAEMVIDGKPYRTKPITLTVDDSRKAAPPPSRQAQDPFANDPFLGGDVDDIFNQMLQRRGVPNLGGGTRTQPTNPDEAFFIQVEVDKTDVFEGEQVTASYYLMTPYQVRDIDTLKYPSLKGFWKEDIEIATRLNFQREVVNGVPYNKALLASYALFPIKAGEVVVDSYRAKCTIMTQMNMLGMGTPYQFTKASLPVKVKAKALPKDTQPKDFSGAVGQFTVTSKLDGAGSRVPVNQPFTLKIRVEGRGNAKVIDLPPLELPPDLELYDQKSESKFFKDGTSFKEFNLLLIPRRTGEFTIPSVTISSFDTGRKQYEQSKTDSFVIQVGEGRANEQFQSTPLADTPDEKKKRQGLPPVMTDFEISAGLDSKILAGIWLAIFLGIFGGLFWKAKIELGWGKREKTAVEKAVIRLKAANKFLDQKDYRKLGAEGLNTINIWLAGVSQDGAADEDFESLMLKIPPTVKTKVESPLRDLVKYFEGLAFAPESLVDSLKTEAKAKLKALEKIIS